MEKEANLDEQVFYVALLELRRGLAIDELANFCKLPVATIKEYLNDKERIVKIFNATNSDELRNLVEYKKPTDNFGELVYETIQKNLQEYENDGAKPIR